MHSWIYYISIIFLILDRRFNFNYLYSFPRDEISSNTSIASPSSIIPPSPLTPVATRAPRFVIVRPRPIRWTMKPFKHRAEICEKSS